MTALPVSSGEGAEGGEARQGFACAGDDHAEDLGFTGHGEKSEGRTSRFRTHNREQREQGRLSL